MQAAVFFTVHRFFCGLAAAAGLAAVHTTHPLHRLALLFTPHPLQAAVFFTVHRFFCGLAVVAGRRRRGRPSGPSKSNTLMVMS